MISDPNFIPSTDCVNCVQDSASYSAYLSSITPSGIMDLFGTVVATPYVLLADDDVANRSIWAVNSGASYIAAGQRLSSDKIYNLERTTNLRVDLYEDGISVANSIGQLSSGLPSSEINIGNENRATDIRYLAGTIGQYMIASALTTGNPAHNTNLRTLLTAL